MQTLITFDDQDPQECVDCVALGEPCPYHRGWADAWDQCAEVVGAMVFAQQGGDR
jgi:hypothetical protein